MAGCVRRRGGRSTCQRVRAWLLQQADAAEFREACREAGVPVMEKGPPMRPPEAYDPHKHEKREKNYGADISTLIRMIEAGEI